MKEVKKISDTHLHQEGQPKQQGEQLPLKRKARPETRKAD
jgi:hypothetical protein